MFTGLIEETGTIRELNSIEGGRTIRIESERISSDLSPDDSIAVNGVCLTATDVDIPYFKVTAVDETLSKTTLEQLRPGSTVNLERAMRLGDRMGGHIVQGHVDGKARILSVNRKGGGLEVEIRISQRWMKYIVEKGSVCIDGISLTVATLIPKGIRISVIPYTVQHTNLVNLQKGMEVNLEVDILAKYLEKLLKRDGNSEAHGVEWYTSQGF